MVSEVEHMMYKENTAFVQPKKKGQVQQKSYCCLQMSDWKIEKVEPYSSWWCTAVQQYAKDRS